MKLIVITLPHFFDGEVAAVTALFRHGLELLHLRKPEATVEELEHFLLQIPPEYLPRIVIHEHFRLATRFGLKGIHLNRRHPKVPDGYAGHISCSCHSLDEVRQRKADCDYLFLSPIYDSISKTGYAAAFSRHSLQEAHRSGIIDSKVIALGGINLDCLPEVKALGFGGAALLGDIWQRKQEDIVPHFLQMQHAAKGEKCKVPIVLSIAGSDSSGGAGIQADIKTISALGGYAASVVTAVTAQNTLGVQAVYPVPADIVKAQITSVMDDLPPAAVKIGMVYDADTACAIAECLLRHRPRFIVYDPVMVSTSGRRLMTEETIGMIREKFFPLCTLVTPNLNEASLLCGHPVTDVAEMHQSARELCHHFGTAVLIKGGHLAGDEMCDVLCQYPSLACTQHTSPKIESHNLHGTGCTLSSAIATLLAGGCSLEEAVSRAKGYTAKAIANGRELHVGHGNGPLWHF